MSRRGLAVIGTSAAAATIAAMAAWWYSNAAGLELAGRLGPPLAYFARLRPQVAA